jgi:hypothetical protein
MNFPALFYQRMNEMFPNGIDWELVGILTKRQEVYTLSHDSKILSGIFEILCEPIIRSIASDQGLEFAKGVQNQYPEFTLTLPGNSSERIAIDVKSTYRQWDKKGKLKPFGFTLGSYRSYLRDPAGKKGILFPYHEYSAHWIIGFLYSRNEACRTTEIKSIIDAAQLQAPFSDIEYFVQEKHRIAGKTPGSGNTTNIGSIRCAQIDDFRRGVSDFENTEDFELYWTNYSPREKK